MDNGKTFGFGIAGFFAGGFLGFLFRPSVFLVGQLSFDQVLSRGSNLKGLDAMLIPTAQTSFNMMIAGALIGCVAGIFISSRHKT